MIANEFVVEINDKPGQLAKLCELIGTNDINIKAITTGRQGGQTFVRLLVDKDDKLRKALDAGKMVYSEDTALIKTVSDKPNALTEIARKLGAAGVNIDAIYVLNRGTSKVNLVLALDNPEKGADIIKD